MTAKRGRPRTFDRQVALRRAMEVFWRRGYQGASMTDLTAAMGIGSPSLYAAFGSKEALFREAVDLYNLTEGAVPGRRSTVGTPPARQSRRCCVTTRTPMSIRRIRADA